MNSLSLEGMPAKYNSDHGRYYYSFEFEHYMQAYNEDLKRRANTYGDELDKRKGVLQSIKPWLAIDLYPSAHGQLD